MNTTRQTWLVVGLFGMAMAWMEAATVFYLRTLIGRLEPYQPRPLTTTISGLDRAELAREAATMLMLLTVGWLAGRTWRARLAYWLIAFGVWDIFYYVFLKVLTGWPQSLFSWDVLFLLPLPWWGPVAAPVSIALLMILWGTLVARYEGEAERLCLYPKAYALNIGGIGLALYVFMADSIGVLGEGQEAFHTLLPTQFNWPLFGLAWLLMAVPVADAGRQAWQRRCSRFART